MNSSSSDAELGRILRAKAAECGYSPDAFLVMAEERAEWTKWSVNWVAGPGPFPHTILVETLGQDNLSGWPDWSEELIPAGCQLERLEWRDGRVTTRLKSPRGRVLAANIQPPSLT